MAEKLAGILIVAILFTGATFLYSRPVMCEGSGVTVDGVVECTPGSVDYYERGLPVSYWRSDDVGLLKVAFAIDFSFFMILGAALSMWHGHHFRTRAL